MNITLEKECLLLKLAILFGFLGWMLIKFIWVLLTPIWKPVQIAYRLAF